MKRFIVCFATLLFAAPVAALAQSAGSPPVNTEQRIGICDPNKTSNPGTCVVVNNDGSINADTTSSVLPTGAATSALQSTLNGYLAPYTYTNITIATNTIVKASAGTFGGLTINTAGNLASAIVYDGATCAGTVIGTFSTTAQGTILFGGGVAALTGICVTTADTTTPANLTVLWR